MIWKFAINWINNYFVFKIFYKIKFFNFRIILISNKKILRSIKKRKLQKVIFSEKISDFLKFIVKYLSLEKDG